MSCISVCRPRGVWLPDAAIPRYHWTPRSALIDKPDVLCTVAWKKLWLLVVEFFFVDSHLIWGGAFAAVYRLFPHLTICEKWAATNGRVDPTPRLTVYVEVSPRGRGPRCFSRSGNCRQVWASNALSGRSWYWILQKHEPQGLRSGCGVIKENSLRKRCICLSERKHERMSTRAILRRDCDSAASRCAGSASVVRPV